jgi:hypothetical protein
MADSIKRRHWALKELYNKEGITIIYRVTQGTQADKGYTVA